MTEIERKLIEYVFGRSPLARALDAPEIWNKIAKGIEKNLKMPGTLGYRKVIRFLERVGRLNREKYLSLIDPAVIPKQFLKKKP